MKSRVLVAGMVLSICSIGPAQEITTLTVSDAAKVARSGEPITNGVPLPRGLVRDAAELSLRSGQAVLPASFSVLNRWHEDGSIRWALLDTQLDLPAGGSAQIKLVKGNPPGDPPGRLAVTGADDTISIDTGPIQFAVRRQGFRLFEWLVLDGEPLLAAAGGGLTMTADGKTYSTASDAKSVVTIEENTPMRVALLADGRLTDESGKTGFDYQVRIHAHRGSPLIRVAVTVIKKYGQRRDSAKVSGLSLELALRPVLIENESLPFEYAFGTDKSAPARGVVNKSAFVHCDTSDSFKLGGEASGTGQAKSVKPLTLGWGDVSRGGVGVAAGVRRCWQTFPKAIEAVGDKARPGLLVHLFPPMHPEPVEVFTGMARTHEVLIVPHGRTTPEQLQARFVAFQEPLYAFASPRWYCRDSGGLGLLAEAAELDPRLYGPHAEAVGAFDRKLSDILTTLAGPARDRWSNRGVTMDAYGWLAFGDTLHWVWLAEDGAKEPLGSPWTIAWDSNYYDLPHLAVQHFARTGRREFFEFFLDHSRHLADVGVMHWEPNAPAGGGSRRCPATNHVGYDPPDHNYAIVNYAFDHHKSESLFERYYLLGDRRALSAAMSLLGHAFDPAANAGRNGDYAGTRKPAHQILTLVGGYRCTGDHQYLVKAREVIDAGIERQKVHGGGLNPKPNFTDGLCSEAFAKYYLATGEQDVLDSVIALNDHLLGRGYRFANQAMGFGLAFNRTGDEKYLAAGLRVLQGRPGHLGKDTASMFRNAADFFGQLAERMNRTR